MRLAIGVFLFGQVITKELSLRGKSDYLYTLPALEIWKDDCSRQALLSILPQCLDGLETMISSQQKEVALELSICELENAKIEYPLDCNPQIRQRNVDKCIQSLEKSPQFWTSYSGNYRSVKEICHQVSMPLKKEQIVEVYENVSNLFQNILNDFMASQADNEEFQNHMKEKFDAMLNIIDEMMEKRRESADLVNQTFNVFYENFELSLNNALVIMGQSYQGVNTNLNEMGHHINYFTKELCHINELIRENQNQLGRKHKDLQQHGDILLSQQSQVLENMKGINDYALELQGSTRRYFEFMDNELQLSVFKMHSINALIDHNLDTLQVQKKSLNQQSVSILSGISEDFALYLNRSGQEILASFENSLNISLEKLEERVEQTMMSIELLDSRVGNFISIANNATEYLANLIPNFARSVMSYASESYISMKTAFSQTYRIILCLVVAVVLLIAKPFVLFPWTILRKSVIVVIPLTLGVVAAILTLKLVLVLSDFNMPD